MVSRVAARPTAEAVLLTVVRESDPDGPLSAIRRDGSMLSPAVSLTTIQKVESRRLSNVGLWIAEGTLHGEVDLALRLGPSRSGRSILVTTTHGQIYMETHGGIHLSMTVFRYGNLEGKGPWSRKIPDCSPAGNMGFEVVQGTLRFSVDLASELYVSPDGAVTIASTRLDESGSVYVAKPPRLIKMALDVWRSEERTESSNQGPSYDQLSLL